MRVLVITLSLVALIFGHPAPAKDDHPSVYHMRSFEADGKVMNIDADEPSVHNIQKRDVENEAHSIEKRQAEGTNDTAIVNGEDQVAHSNEGAVAIQGVNGQHVYASDKGGPIVQIQQQVYKSSCCGKESGCSCKGNNETMSESTETSTTGP